MSPRQRQTRDLLVHIDRALPRSLRRQLEDQLRDAIRSGALAPGSELPSTRALAQELGVSRGVTGRAYVQLAAEGYLELRQGANPAVRNLARVQLAPDAAPVRAGARVRYDLRPHLPDVNSFPRQAWLRSVRTALAGATSAELGYIGAQGLQQLRVEIAGYLGRARGVAADPDRIVITTGTAHSLSLLARALTHLGAQRMAFENPSHFVLREVVKHAGQTPVPVALDSEGVRIDSLRAAGAQSAVVAPAHQFPTGVVLSAERRRLLIEWAQTSGGLVLEDDYDAAFRYDRAPIGALQGLSPEHVVYLGSTGKSLAPAMRLGWAVLPARLVDPIVYELAAGMIQLPGIDQLALADFLHRGEFDRHLSRMRTIYRRRRDALVDALETWLPDCPVRGIAAGLHAVVELPSADVEEAVCARATSIGVLVQSLTQHALPGYDGPAAVLVGYGPVPEAAIPRAVQQLAEIVGNARPPLMARAG
jgi:GntR family transcriptional regulator/MocR family aminotransferase